MMTTNESTHAALTAVLTEANAKVCGSCGTQAAVRVSPAPNTAMLDVTAHSATHVWFCFECGHEEPAID
ncbi:MAG TPA: hypothetical protein VH583_01430 [Vicinamibacterales bacterium]